METAERFTSQIHRSLEQEQGSKKDRQMKHVMGMNTSG